jgi:hypothetical protein
MPTPRRGGACATAEASGDVVSTLFVGGDPIRGLYDDHLMPRLKEVDALCA